jgi:hypothetical protein
VSNYIILKYLFLILSLKKNLGELLRALSLRSAEGADNHGGEEEAEHAVERGRAKK